MKLHYKKLGEGKPLVVLHGVFGSSDNLYTVCKQISEQGFEVFILDARNHGQSPRSEEFNYKVLAEDLNAFLEEQGLDKPAVLGHSMGGKTVLQFSQMFDNYSKLIVVDIAAKGYSPHHSHIIEGLQSINLSTLASRKEAELTFSKYVTDPGEQMFLLKNLYRTDSGGFDWRINVPVLAKNSENVVAAIPLSKKVESPLLLMRGGDSNYVSDRSVEDLRVFYSNLKLETIAGANHWIHAIKPKEFVEITVQFLQDT
jgi:esterase